MAATLIRTLQLTDGSLFIQPTTTYRQLNRWVDLISTTNITVASPGSSIGGGTPVGGERVLLAGQTTATENGVYIFNGAASAMTRATDMNATNALRLFDQCYCKASTYANKVYQCTACIAPWTAGATSSTWADKTPATGSTTRTYDAAPTTTPNGATTIFSWTGTWTANAVIFLNGQRLVGGGADYTVSYAGSNQVTFVTAPLTGDIIRADYD